MRNLKSKNKQLRLVSHILFSIVQLQQCKEISVPAFGSRNTCPRNKIESVVATRVQAGWTWVGVPVQ